MESTRDFSTDAEWTAYELGVEDGLAGIEERISEQVENRLQQVHREPDAGRGAERRNRPVRPCIVPNCTADAHAKGFCPRHYARNRDYGDPTHPYIARPERMRCMVPSCDKSIKHLGMCDPHYRGFLKARKEYKEDGYLAEIFGNTHEKPVADSD